MDSFKIDCDLFFVLPLSVPIGKKGKEFILNLNRYRNAHFRILAEAKENFNVLISDLNLNTGGENYPFKNPVKFTYYYYPKTRAKYDRMNVLSIIDKFTCDALITEGILINDTYDLVLTPDFLHCKVDSKNPRIEVAIKEIKT